MKRLLGSRGLSLVEVLIAMVVLLFVSLALMQTALVSIESNMKNVLRDEAVAIAEERINEARSLGFGSAYLVSDAIPLVVLPAANGCPADFVGAPRNFVNGVAFQKNLKNVTNFVFCTNRTVTARGIDNTQVDVTVGWQWKGLTYTHTATAVIRNDS